MSRLYDRILTAKETRDFTRKSFLKNPPVVVSADDVVQYVINNRDIAIAWDKQPFYKSPFHYIFIEAQRPIGANHLPYAWGIGYRWIEAMDIYKYSFKGTFEEWWEAKKQRFPLPNVPDTNLREVFIEIYGASPEVYYHEDIRPVEQIHQHGEMFVQEEPSSKIETEWGIDLNFHPGEDIPYDIFSFSHDISGKAYDRKIGEHKWERTEAGKERIFNLATPLFMAMTLINCKNVELSDRYPLRYEQQKHERKHHQPLVTYKTIKVNPMRTAKHYTDLDTQAAPHEPQPNNAPLHIARGHFKDYRDGKGLFGKLRGVYWWDQHVRGNIENGAVIKDYDVQAPKGKTP